MTTTPPEFAPYANAYALETSYQDTVSPAVKILAALYIARAANDSNKPSKSDADTAEKVIIDWLDRLLDLAKLLFLLPHFRHVSNDNSQVFEDTVQRLRDDVTSLRSSAGGSLPSRVAKPGTDPAVVASQLLLRMQWSLDWVKSHMQSAPPVGATKKIWVSHLDEKTCTVACRKMHGTSIPINESFTPSALDQGVPKGLLYGSLWGPPIHPNCRCRLIYI